MRHLFSIQRKLSVTTLFSDNNEAIANVSDEEQANEWQNIEATDCDVSKSQALDSIRKLQSFALKGDHFSLYENWRSIDVNYCEFAKRQTKITDYKLFNFLIKLIGN